MTTDEYRKRFSEPLLSRSEKDIKETDTRAGRAFSYAFDIRKFEIELYWKRDTYFWTFIAAAFAGYALTYKTSDHEPWLSLLFSALGLVLSVAWYLVNRGSKFWQSNWGRYVDLLEDFTLGPLYKVVAVTQNNLSKNPLTSPAQFSVSKLNQILSAFVVVVWVFLFIRSLLSISFDPGPDPYKIAAVGLVAAFSYLLYRYGKSSSQFTCPGLHDRNLENET